MARKNKAPESKPFGTQSKKLNRLKEKNVENLFRRLLKLKHNNGKPRQSFLQPPKLTISISIYNFAHCFHIFIAIPYKINNYLIKLLFQLVMSRMNVCNCPSINSMDNEMENSIVNKTYIECGVCIHPKRKHLISTISCIHGRIFFLFCLCALFFGLIIM